MTTPTIYRVTLTDGREDSEHASLDAACDAVRYRMTWEECVCSDSFPLGAREGRRGSVYGVECYPSQDDCDGHPDGDPHAPRIAIVDGDEAWAIGRDEEWECES